ncbi:hypothetical protein [Lactococcus lactis]|uniref:hypothetical protein n=1 Tax=Lactococcus lactis TaxID=1358 RepID=UPI00223BE035|nr:hypothetical protein [Lactococcus lactis]MCT0028069.1 hypothetical protein [Lactococcus lactis subsp. lactis]MCT3105441.1 hypothetical protein [Lactococcus lactis]
MSEVEQSFDSQRIKIVEYLEKEGFGNKDVIRAYENIKEPPYKFAKTDISSVLNGNRKYTQSVKWFITFLIKYFDLD